MKITKDKYKEILEIQGISYNENSKWFTVSLDRINETINYTRCCTELPTKETIKNVASNKALKYAYANEDTYEDYVKAIEEGADYVKNYLTKHK